MGTTNIKYDKKQIERRQAENIEYGNKLSDHEVKFQQHNCVGEVPKRKKFRGTAQLIWTVLNIKIAAKCHRPGSAAALYLAFG